MSTRRRKDHRTIIHFDYDCFYASVFEHENPALKSLPLAVQQKQIIVTCNYEARRRGLRKLQLITDAKARVPDLIIVLGEDISRFRDVSKDLYKFLASFTWSGKVERLGFDEVFMDVSDIVDYNIALLNNNDLPHSFFQLDRKDPINGFAFDATIIAGHACPKASAMVDSVRQLDLQLILGSHLAQHLRWTLDEEKGYTCTVGISTNKLLSKLVGNLNKPQGQTTLLTPYEETIIAKGPRLSNITVFMDNHDIGKVPGCGFRSSQRIRDYVLSRPSDFEHGLIYGGTKESVTVRDVRTYPGMGPDLLEQILGGPGSEKGIGGKIWGLINGIDDTEVKEARKVPAQISIEDSYIRLDTMAQVLKELRMLGTSLLRRMHIDLLEDAEADVMLATGVGQRWIAHPKTLRLSTRPRPPLNADGTRTRSFARISTSGPLPRFAFGLKDGFESTAEKLVQEALMPMFRKLHPQPSGWNLSLVNVCVTGMVEAASEDRSGEGRDIGRMFRRQEDVLKDWKVLDEEDSHTAHELETANDHTSSLEPDRTTDSLIQTLVVYSGENRLTTTGSEDAIQLAHTQPNADKQMLWQEEDEDDEESCNRCPVCGASMPAFAMAAHERFHDVGE